MNTHVRNAVIISALTMFFTACGGERESGTDPLETAGEQPAPTVTTGKTVELASNTTDQKAITVGPGNFISGQFLAPENGKVESFSILIGNYFNTSDGNLNIELCQKDQCKTGSSALESSTDNSLFQIKLNNTLEVTVDEPVTYKLTKTDGKNEVAVWTFTPDDRVPAIIGPDGKSANAAPKIALIYSN